MGESLIAAPANLAELMGILTQLAFFGTPLALLLVLFFWNMYQLIMTVGDVEKKKQARDRIVFGVLVLFVVFSLAGLVALLQGTFFPGLENRPQFTAPVGAPADPEPIRTTPPPETTDPVEGETRCANGNPPPCPAPE